MHFVNQTQRGQLKVCKALGPAASDLIGEQFYAPTRRSTTAQPASWITAAASTQCMIVGYFPIGITVDRDGETSIRTAGRRRAAEFIDRTGEGEVTIAPGINTMTITNTAKGLLEVCKAQRFEVRRIE